MLGSNTTGSLVEPPRSATGAVRTWRVLSQLRLLATAARPRQMVKNVLVLAAPFAAGALLDPGVLGPAAVAVLAFAAASAGVYLLNDVLDVEADRRHPTKRHRPVAAGTLSAPVALGASAALLLAGLLGALLATPLLALVLGVYAQLQLAYCLWLRRQPVLDICVVAAGFVLRVVAGAAATGVPLSPWFLSATAFGSLFMVSGRRYAEMKIRDRTGGATRASLDGYSSSYLRFVWSSSATMAILAYLSWAYQTSLRTESPYAGLAAAPFVLAVLVYALDVDRGTAGAPEDIAFGNRALQILAVIWLVAMAVTAYL